MLGMWLAMINGHFRNLNWRLPYLPYISGLFFRPMFQGISQQDMTRNMVHLRTSIYVPPLKWDLVGGFKHVYFPFHIWDNLSHWLIFFKMVKTTNQRLPWWEGLPADHERGHFSARNARETHRLPEKATHAASSTAGCQSGWNSHGNAADALTSQETQTLMQGYPVNSQGTQTMEVGLPVSNSPCGSSCGWQSRQRRLPICDAHSKFTRDCEWLWSWFIE